MTSLYQKLYTRFQDALAKVCPSEQTPVDPVIRRSQDEKFGDYQSNVAMGLAKKLKKSPRDLAQEIIDRLDLEGICEDVTLAGPGFINMTLSKDFLKKYLLSMKIDERLGAPSAEKPLRHLVDFSSPNLAKEMHIGHLRTTITGEAIARILEFQGHAVERVSHVGDWGTQFGMLLEYLLEVDREVLKNPKHFCIQDLQIFYKAAKERFDHNPEFANAARKRVVLLQSGDTKTKKLWHLFVKESSKHCREIYEKLKVSLQEVGESFYNDRLAHVVKEFQEKGLAVKDQEAICVFLEGFTNREGEPLPMIIQKSDSGYNYSTTDLAALKYRIQEKKADRVIYVTDIRQSQHFEMLFTAARKAGWVEEKHRLDHIGYGMILGEDRRPFRTRDGKTVRLKDVIEEAVERSRKIVENNRNISLTKQEQIANAVGLAAIKYFDLSHNLSSDYVFHWDHMLAMDGNTGPYMLYAYARIQSIGRKSGLSWADVLEAKTIFLDHPSEIALAKALVRFPEVLDFVTQDLKPHYLTDYLYSLSKVFSGFYDKLQGVRVIDAETLELKLSRLFLCLLTARTLKLGLDLLSIEVVDEM